MPPERCFGIGVGEVRQAHQRHVALDDLGALRARWRGSPPAQAELDVAAHREPGKDAVLLEDHAAVRARARRSARRRAAPGRRWADEAADDVEQRRLAAARRADDRDELALATSRSTSSTTRIGPRAVGKSTPTSSKRMRVRATAVIADGRTAHAIRSCQATSRRVAARSTRSIARAIRPMQMMPT